MTAATRAGRRVAGRAPSSRSTPRRPALQTAWRSVALAAVALLTLGGCDLSAAETEVRVANLSSVDFSTVTLGFARTTVAVGAVPARGTTGYLVVDEAYDYGTIRVETAEGTYGIQAIDFVGEEPLPAGRYTYRLTLIDGQLGMTFQAD